MDPSTRGKEALGSGDWSAARDHFRAALDEAETPDALFGLGEALWWLGDLHDAVDLRARAYAAFREAGRDAEAFACAYRLSVDHLASLGNRAAAEGWAGRASRLAESTGLPPLGGWSLLLQAYLDPDPRQGETMARQAHESARELGDVDLELSAASQVGAALVGQGRVAEGVKWLDEAMAGCLGGEPREPGTVVFACCTTITSCRSCAEFERAVQWIQAADRFAQRFGCPFLYVECRMVYGGVLVATGEWERAEDELARALEMARDSVPARHTEVLAALAELRLAQGRLDEAEGLIAGLEDHAPALAVAARLLMEKGEEERAVDRARRGLAALEAQPLAAAPLRELLGQVAAGRGRLDEARAQAEQLLEVGREEGCRIVAARGRRLEGRIHLSGGVEGAAPRPDASASARSALEAALHGFVELGLPLEADRTRLLLARCLHDETPEAAVAEARRALQGFRRLGAARDADRAAALLRELGVRAAPSSAASRGQGTRGEGPEAELTLREREVLKLLAEGLSNREIGRRLFISPKTAEHHVTRILSKLGVRNRTQAAAVALRRR